MNYADALAAAVDAAKAAGALLQSEFLGGTQRGTPEHCPADGAAEQVIRQRLLAFRHDVPIRGEELGWGSAPRVGASHCWLVDPNDGTKAFQAGWRGAAVSIALLREGVPVLGVVFAYAARAGRGDLIAWAEGQPLTRNGNVLETRNPAARGDGPATIFVSQNADKTPVTNARTCAPARFRPLPSIAYRLALLAAGEGIAAVSLADPKNWDVAAGHALLRAVGGELYRLDGTPVRYGRDGSAEVGDCIGTWPDRAGDLVHRPWHDVLDREAPLESPFPLVFPKRDALVSDPGLLERAQGCLLGQLAGDNLGALVEFQNAAGIAQRYPGGPRALEDGGHWNILAGQPTDDSELALSLARSIVATDGYDPESAAQAYARWIASGPFDCGHTISAGTSAALYALERGERAAPAAKRAAEGVSSQANGALMRVSPLAVWAHAFDDDRIAAFAREDALLTHADRVCQDANAVFCVAIAYAIRAGDSPEAVYRYASDWASAHDAHPDVLDMLRAARSGPPDDYRKNQGWVRIALRNAFYRLLSAGSAEEGVARSAAAGGDTDTNAAIAGALLGAVYGAEAIPFQWVDRLLTCRPLETLRDCDKPRPPAFWPVDCLHLAERLIHLGQRSSR
jgi:ADP-ribosylglycohydrolase/fructose-1,6-bisphosphatase/inositol monophosphatase family enzyme